MSFTTEPTTVWVATGIFSWRSAEALALSWDWLNSSAFSWSASSAVCPSG